MNWIKGRPDDWGNPYRVDWPADGRVIFEQGASAMLAARDKEWVAGVEKSELVNPMLDDCGYLCDSCIWECDCPNNQWQQLKKDMGVKE